MTTDIYLSTMESWQEAHNCLSYLKLWPVGKYSCRKTSVDQSAKCI